MYFPLMNMYSNLALFFAPSILRTLRSGQGNGNLLVLSSGLLVTD
jgi:hypothetical protein